MKVFDDDKPSLPIVLRRARQTTVRAMAVTWAVFILVAQATAAGQPKAYDAAIAEFRAGNYQQSRTILEGLLRQSPANAPAELLLARCDDQLGDYQAAVSHAGEAVKLEPGNAKNHLWLGRMMGREANEERSPALALKTRREFKKAVDLAPGNISARRALLEYDLDAPWFLGGSKLKARAQADAIARLDPIEGQLAKARLAEAAGNPAMEAACYRQVLDEKPARVGPYFEAADFFIAKGNTLALERAIDGAAVVDGKDRRLAYYRGVWDVLTGTNLANAQHDLKTYVDGPPLPHDFPSRADAVNWLGKLYEQKGNRELAMQEYQVVLRIDPSRTDARQALDRLQKDP